MDAVRRQEAFDEEFRTSTHVIACPRVTVVGCPAYIPKKWFEQLEENQKLSSCCRHPENHDIEARYSSADWKNRVDPRGYPETHPNAGQPDIYIFHCTCGRKHQRFLVGVDAYRPVWS